MLSLDKTPGNWEDTQSSRVFSSCMSNVECRGANPYMHKAECTMSPLRSLPKWIHKQVAGYAWCGNVCVCKCTGVLGKDFCFVLCVCIWKCMQWAAHRGECEGKISSQNTSSEEEEWQKNGVEIYSCAWKHLNCIRVTSIILLSGRCCKRLTHFLCLMNNGKGTPTLLIRKDFILEDFNKEY